MSQYEEQTVAELQELAAEREIPSRTTMKKAELIEALEASDPAPRASEEFPDLPENEPTQSLEQRFAILEERVTVMEARIQAIDDRTRASSQILGQTT